jgi:hypothetical protein
LVDLGKMSSKGVDLIRIDTNQLDDVALVARPAGC